MRIGIALGSNLGDSEQNVRSACEFLRTLHDGSGPFLQSKLHRTKPLDCPPNSPDFVNAAIELSSTIPPFDLLDLLQHYEISHGRPADHGFHQPRTIDLDILYCDQIHLHHPRLTIPHPRIATRPFVLRPLNDICPDRPIRPDGRTVRELCGVV
ncbi:MAG: 2-amino-4-hydroxy-6-hydroxymethyldihydropteridine diphosphokinase [Terrimicrobiaceae bacterium]|nr:2-amino-4-hydroxy-6-hydroxymethyldihydropteridine diphosphokinase [Terrimicrobiaceae bacterium]